MNNYKEMDVINGIMNVEIKSWKDFHSYVVEEMLNYSHYIWRGQRDSDWDLHSSIDRLIDKTEGKDHTKSTLNSHLEKFKMASRGRRSPVPARQLTEDEWWALGQHNSLATPLLDWTRSPFVALYFAFEKEQPPKSGSRAVWALSGTDQLNEKITTPEERLRFIRPLQDDNSRLVSQGGLFTRAPIKETVKTWIEKHATEGEAEIAHLIKIIIPDAGREECLRTLNMMNINHVTLFPDLYGASQHCNKTFSINKYHN